LKFCDVLIKIKLILNRSITSKFNSTDFFYIYKKCVKHVNNYAYNY